MSNVLAGKDAVQLILTRARQTQLLALAHGRETGERIKLDSRLACPYRLPFEGLVFEKTLKMALRKRELLKIL